VSLYLFGRCSNPIFFFVCGSGTSRLPARRPALPPCRPRVSAAAAASFRPPPLPPRPPHAALRPPRAALRPPIPAFRRAGRATATARVAATTTGVVAAAARCGEEPPRPPDRIAAVGRRSSSPLQTGDCCIATLGSFQYQKHLSVLFIEYRYRKGWMSPVQGFCCTILSLRCVDAVHHEAINVTKSETPVPPPPAESLVSDSL
jgi:hypothetical protein